jgi:hypothetical protein
VPGTGNFASLAPPTFVQRAQQEAARASEKLSFGGYPNPVVAEKKRSSRLSQKIHSKKYSSTVQLKLFCVNYFDYHGICFLFSPTLRYLAKYND